MALSEKADKLDKHIVKLYDLIDDELGPLLTDADEKLERIDGVATSIIEASQSANMSKRTSALEALEKIHEIFRIFR